MKGLIASVLLGTVLCFSPVLLAQNTQQSTGNTDTGSTSTNTGSGVSQAGSGNIVNQGGVGSGAGGGDTIGGTGGTGGSGGAGGTGGTGIGEGGKGGNATSTSVANGGNAKSNSNSNANSVAVTNSKSSASNNSTVGGGNGNVSIQTPRNTASAIAPVGFPTANCMKPYAGAGQGAAFGFSFGGSKQDQNCEELEVARSFASVGDRVDYCKVMLLNKFVKKAGVSFDDCVYVPVVEPVIVEAPAVQSQPDIIINVPPTQINIVKEAAPVVVAPVIEPKKHYRSKKGGCTTTAPSAELSGSESTMLASNEVITNDNLSCELTPDTEAGL